MWALLKWIGILAYFNKTAVIEHSNNLDHSTQYDLETLKDSSLCFFAEEKLVDGQTLLLT